MSITQELRACQKDALAIISSRRIELDETNISMCTGSGKSVVIRDTSCSANRVILVFPSLGLITQFHRDHHQVYAEKNLFYLATEGTLKGVVRFPAELALSAYVVLTTYDSVPQILATLSDDRQIDMLIADEAHHVRAPVFSAAYASKKAFIQHTIHFSATLPEDKEPHYKYPLLKGIRDSVVRDFNIELFICKNGEETGLLQMIDKLVALHEGKAKILIYTAQANTDGSSVRTFMAQYASVVRARGWWIEGINKDTTDRDPLLRTFESDKSPATILVSCRTLSEGIDLKNANCMLPWDPTASVIDNIQRIGRVVRLYKTAAGAIAKDQPPSTILIPVFLEEADYAACGGDRDAIHKLLEKQISDGEKGNFRPIVNVCTALKSELAEEDSDLFNQLLNYGHTPKVRIDRDLVACVAKQLKRPEEDVLKEVADSLVKKGELDEEVIDSIREGEWGSEETGAVVTALAESQGITLVIRDNEEEEVVGAGTKDIVVERKGEGVYTASRKKKSSDAARQRVAHRLRTSFSDGCRIMLGLEGAELSATEGLVLARLTAEVQYDEDWEKRRLEWVAFYDKTGRTPIQSSANKEEVRLSRWQSQQRVAKKKCYKRMTNERILTLTNTKGWDWKEEDPFDVKLLEWADFFSKNYRCPSGMSLDPYEKSLGCWQTQRRNDYKHNRPWMTTERVAKFNSTPGWKWLDGRHDRIWEEGRNNWIDVCKILGHNNPSRSSGETKNEERANIWQRHQRGQFNKGTLSACRIKVLEDTPGWSWSADSPSITPLAPTPAPTNEVVYPTETPTQKKTLVRKRVILTEAVSTKEAKPRPLSVLEELHKAYKTRNADTYFSLMQTDPSKFEEYHAIADTYDTRDPPERKPQNRIAEMLKKINRPSYRAIDLGCGRNTLRRDERVAKMSWDSVDVVAADSTVTVADMGHLPFEDETYDIAILNRSLWARNHEEVLHEVWRILKEGGRAILCESFQRWNEAGENTLLAALKTVGFTILSEVGTTTDSDVEDVFQYIEVRR